MFTQHNGRTPLMEVVRSNMLDMVKVLIYATDDRAVWETKDTTDVDLSVQDNDGKSMIHHCVQNRKVRTKSNQVTGYTTVATIPYCKVNFLHNAKLSDCWLYSWLARDIMVFMLVDKSKGFLLLFSCLVFPLKSLGTGYEPKRVSSYLYVWPSRKSIDQSLQVSSPNNKCSLFFS